MIIMGMLSAILSYSTLGQTLRNYFRENDIIGRIGGDEFVIYMCKTERQRWYIFFSKSRIVLYNDDISQECRHNIIYTKHIMHE